MKWSFEKLLGYKREPFTTHKTVDLKDDLIHRYPETILDSTPFEVTAKATPDNGDIIIDADVKGSVTVPSSRSLTPVKLPMDFHISEIYVLTETALNRYDNEEVVLIVGDSGLIDFDKAVADNVIVNIPMQVLSPEEQNGKGMPKGNDWEVISEDDFNRQEKEDKNVDPRLAKLKDFKPSDDDKT